MSRLATTLAAIFAACGAFAPAAGSAAGAQGAPLGAWRAANECFLAVFVLTEDGRAQAAYLSGERDGNAAWIWDGSTLTITSPVFPLDSFTGRLANERLEADYVWHDLEKDELNRQTCVFERIAPPEL